MIFISRFILWTLIVGIGLTAGTPLEAAVISLKSGRTIEGRIVGEADDFIEVDVGIDRPIKFYRDEILSIESGEKPKTDVISAPPVVLPEEGRKTFLWKVTSDNTHAYIFGSIHLGKPEMYPLPPQVEQAYQLASALVVEVNTQAISPTVLRNRLASRGIFLNGDLLEKHISPETRARLEETLQHYGMTIEPFRQFKPWYMAMNLAVLQIKTLGFDEDMGVDMYFLKRAAVSKPILELETLREQLDYLDNMPDQDKFLAYTLESLNDIEKDLTSFLEDWRGGRVEAVEKLILTDPLQEDPETEGIFQALLFDRNASMSQSIMTFLELKGQVYFIVVGAAHLLGENGILKILERYGYQVEQL